ncbi:DUF2147 domain-containing protein [Acidisphaera sp. S103]|uniref:DUF2147 domain-containing protein n=1 Tax=Acidisphaera sp. S103 TaxID=1747223 RepID=UPI00131D435A|nr:DUF2147 domain-containing protein [Acidisphaera sp. S103]
MTRVNLLGLATLWMPMVALAGNASSASLTGNWARQDGATRINIAPCGDAVCAVNTWVRDPKGNEKLGDTLVMTLKPNTPSDLSGRAYDKRRDMSYSMHISLGPSGMETRGCVLFGVLCKTAEWTRVQ